MKLFLVLCLVAFATALPKFGEKDGSMEEKGKKGPSKGKFMKFILGTDICEDNIPLCPEGSDYFDFISPSDECPTIEEVLAKMEEHKGSMEKDSFEEEYSEEDYSEEDYSEEDYSEEDYSEEDYSEEDYDEDDEDYEERKEGDFGEKEGEFGEKEGEDEKDGKEGKKGGKKGKFGKKFGGKKGKFGKKEKDGEKDEEKDGEKEGEKEGEFGEKVRKFGGKKGGKKGKFGNKGKGGKGKGSGEEKEKPTVCQVLNYLADMKGSSSEEFTTQAPKEMKVCGYCKAKTEEGPQLLDGPFQCGFSCDENDEASCQC